MLTFIKDEKVKYIDEKSSLVSVLIDTGWELKEETEVSDVVTDKKPSKEKKGKND